jgi:hypothetical protein
MEGRTFGDVPLNVELKLEVWDSPNSAGVVIDAVRCAKLALDNGVAGALIGPSAYFKKSPPQQFTDDEARRMTEEFIAEMAGNRRSGARAKAAGKRATSLNGSGERRSEAATNGRPAATRATARSRKESGKRPAATRRRTTAKV